MIQKLVKIITDLIALIFGDRAAIKALNEQIASLNKIIDDLHAAATTDAADDAALEAAAADAKAAQKIAEDELTATTAELAAATVKADELVASISADPAVPITVAQDGTVTPA